MNPPAALLDDIKTKQDLQGILNLIDQLLADLYRQKKQSAIPEAFAALAKSRQVDLSNRQQAENFFESLKQELTQIPLIGLTVGFTPSKESVAAIASWVHTNVSNKLILDITVDKEILGGATISFNGFYKDLSLKKVLDDIYKNNREVFSSALKSN